MKFHKITRLTKIIDQYGKNFKYKILDIYSLYVYLYSFRDINEKFSVLYGVFYLI